MKEYSKLLDYLGIEVRNTDELHRIEFEFTSRCNLKCKFCYVANEKYNKNPLLSTDQWKSIIDKCINHGLLRATFTGGEVLSRPDFEELYTSTYDKGVRIAVLTNGVLLDEKKIDIFTKRPPEVISITLYGGSNETYKKLSKSCNGWSIVKNNIENAIKKDLPISLKIVAHPEIPLKEFELVRDFAKELDIPIALVKYLSPIRGCNTKNQDINWRYPAEKIVKLMKLMNEQNTQENSLGCKTAEYFNCNCARNRVAITHDGNITGCLSYTEIQESLLTQDFDDALIKLRNRINKNRINNPGCNKCQYTNRCIKCPGINFSENGDTRICTSYRKSFAEYNIF